MTTPGVPQPPHTEPAPATPPRQRRARLMAGILVGGVALALLIGLVGFIWLGSGSAARFASGPVKPTGPDRYSDTPRCDAFSKEIAEEVDEEFGEPHQHTQAPPKAEEASFCSWVNPPQTSVTLSVQVMRYAAGDGVTGEDRVQAVLSDWREPPAWALKGTWDFAALNEHYCTLLARDSNLLLSVGLDSIAELNPPCDAELLVRYARDWAERNFTR